MATVDKECFPLQPFKKTMWTTMKIAFEESILRNFESTFFTFTILSSMSKELLGVFYTSGLSHLGQSQVVTFGEISVIFYFLHSCRLDRDKVLLQPRLAVLHSALGNYFSNHFSGSISIVSTSMIFLAKMSRIY